jgi:hypothetical protein
VPLEAAKMLRTGIVTRAIDGNEFSAFYNRLDSLLSERNP